ncbi:MAG: sugar phosphate isomerase/epimerase [Chitinophagaceae bacterium]|nr:MAG: sugar phosphate isomerase/epimerase [Chitinophagaceae bacterium]
MLTLATSVSTSYACSVLSPVANKNIGLQLYSLRDVIGKDITGIIEKVAAIGYKEVETYGYSLKDGFWGLDAKAFANLLTKNGMKSPSGHFSMDNFMSGKGGEELKSYIDAANALGSEYVTVPWLGANIRKTGDDFKKIAQKLNEAGGICKSSGLKLAYHNHDFEFAKVGNTTGLEIMLNETDKNLVDFEMDLYWVVRAGYDPLALFKAHPKRFTMWHIKDMDKTNKALNTEIGQGAVNFKSIFAEAKLSGLKHLFVEHETNYKPNQLGSIKTSFDYVKNTLL